MLRTLLSIRHCIRCVLSLRCCVRLPLIPSGVQWLYPDLLFGFWYPVHLMNWILRIQAIVFADDSVPFPVIKGDS